MKMIRRIVSWSDALLVMASWALVFLTPLFVFSFDLSTMLTVISLLLVIFLGFFFAATTQNHFRLQALIVSENTTLISLYNLARLIQPKRAKSLSEVIDAYMISSLDHKLLEHAVPTRVKLDAIIQTVDSLIVTNRRHASLMQNLHSTKAQLFSINHEVALVAKCTMTWHHWIVIVLLTGVFIALILGLRDGSMVAEIFIMFSIVVLLKVLQLIHEVDGNIFLAKHLAYASPQPVFEYIGKLPYYPETALRHAYVALPTVPYRIGMYKNYPTSFEKVIKKVSR